MIGGLQEENGDLNKKYLKKKSKSVGCKYLEALRWISQVEIIHFASWNCGFTSCKIFLQLISSLSCNDSFLLSILQVEFHNLWNCWMVDFFCAFLPCILIWFWQRVRKLQSLLSSWIWASTWFAMNYTKISLILG